MKAEQNCFCCFVKKLVHDCVKQIHTWSQQQMDLIYLLLVQFKDELRNFRFSPVSGKLELSSAQHILSKRQKHREIRAETAPKAASLQYDGV